MFLHNTIRQNQFHTKYYDAKHQQLGTVQNRSTLQAVAITKRFVYSNMQYATLFRWNKRWYTLQWTGDSNDIHNKIDCTRKQTLNRWNRLDFVPISDNDKNSFHGAVSGRSRRSCPCPASRTSSSPRPQISYTARVAHSKINKAELFSLKI